MEFIRKDPITNATKIWTEFIPNDPFCQQSVKSGREFAISNKTRCSDCVHNKDLEDKVIVEYEGKSCQVFQIWNTKPRCKLYGSMKGRFDQLLQRVGQGYALCCPESESNHQYLGLDSETNDILAISYLEEIIPEHIRHLERVYRCQDRITMLRDAISPHGHWPPVNDLYDQVKTIIATLHDHGFSLGEVSLDTVIITEGLLKLNRLKYCSYNVNDKYRFGPMIDDVHVPHLSVFSMERYNGSTRHYFRITDPNNDWIASVSKYGIPVVGKSIDFYRLICAILIHFIHHDHDIEMLLANSWIRQFFLQSEISRFTGRLTQVAQYIKNNPKQAKELDLITCLGDSDSSFALRCDVLD